MVTRLPPQTAHTYTVATHSFRVNCLVSLIVESRPGVQLVFVLRFLAGSGLLRHPTAHAAEAVVAWAMLTTAIYVFNGVTDVPTDAANNSARPIVSGQLSVRTALLWCMLLTATGLLLCWWVSELECVLGAGILALGWAYSAGPSLKNASAGFAVVIGVGAALTYIAGWVARGHISTKDLIMALSISLWVGLCCASKDFSDIDGDRLSGRHTWPVVLGARPAARLLAILAVTGAGCMLTTTLLTAMTVVPVAVMGTGSVALAITARSSAARSLRRVRRRPYRVFMATQYATNAAVMLFVTP